MSSSALESQGTKLYIQNTGVSPVAYQAITEVGNLSGPGGSGNVIDVTDLDSTAKEKRMGLNDEGQLSFDINYIPTNTQHALLRTNRAARTETSFRLDFTDSPITQWTFSAFITGFSVSNTVDDVMKASVTLEITGSISES